ncbi:MAG: biotin/lipoyl-containing protein [Bacteroidales bacterium]
MELELNIDSRKAKVDMLKRDGNQLSVSVDGEVYNLDMVRVAEGIYSIIYKGKSFNVEMIQGTTDKHYVVNTFYNSYEIEVVDAETRYIRNRHKGDAHDGDNSISTPMPGKVVKILVEVGEEVEVGQTVIIVSAMKMESEFKVRKPGIVKAIHVKEGDLVEGHKVMVVIE